MWWCGDVMMCWCGDVRMWWCCDVMMLWCNDVVVWWCGRCGDVMMQWRWWFHVVILWCDEYWFSSLSYFPFNGVWTSKLPLMKVLVVCRRHGRSITNMSLPPENVFWTHNMRVNNQAQLGVMRAYDPTVRHYCFALLHCQVSFCLLCVENIVIVEQKTPLLPLKPQFSWWIFLFLLTQSEVESPAFVCWAPTRAVLKLYVWRFYY